MQAYTYKIESPLWQSCVEVCHTEAAFIPLWLRGTLARSLYSTQTLALESNGRHIIASDSSDTTDRGSLWVSIQPHTKDNTRMDGGRERRWWRVRGNWLGFLAVTNCICTCVLFRWFLFLLLAIFLIFIHKHIDIYSPTNDQCTVQPMRCIGYFSLLFLKKKIVFWYCCCLCPMCTEIKKEHTFLGGFWQYVEYPYVCIHTNISIYADFINIHRMLCC